MPQLLNYQGRVAVGGVNFNGQGQFKFALVNTGGSQTYWSNDGSSVNGAEPAAAVALPVTNGLYSLLLGDPALPNMTAVPAAVFTNADVCLRVWFDDGAHGSQMLTPDQRIAAVGYALMADGVKAGGITGAMIAAGAVGSAQLADGAVGPAQLAPGAAAANLGSSGGQGGAPGGSLVLSPTDNNAALLAAGYVRIGSSAFPDTWQLQVNAAPSARYYHTVVWTGSEMIVFGGVSNNAAVAGGARFDPALNRWTALPAAGPSARYQHTAVWTGSEMIVWGGVISVKGENVFLNDTWSYRLGRTVFFYQHP